MSPASGKARPRGARKLKEATAILRAMARFLSQISWETEVWIAEDPDHVVHFNGERFLGPYPDTVIAQDSR